MARIESFDFQGTHGGRVKKATDFLQAHQDPVHLHIKRITAHMRFGNYSEQSSLKHTGFNISRSWKLFGFLPEKKTLRSVSIVSSLLPVLDFILRNEKTRFKVELK